MSFSLEERQALGIHGLIPPRFKTQDEQIQLCRENLSHYRSDLNKYIYLIGLQVNGLKYHNSGNLRNSSFWIITVCSFYLCRTEMSVYSIAFLQKMWKRWCRWCTHPQLVWHVKSLVSFTVVPGVSSLPFMIRGILFRFYVTGMHCYKKYYG